MLSLGPLSTKLWPGAHHLLLFGGSTKPYFLGGETGGWTICGPKSFLCHEIMHSFQALLREPLLRVWFISSFSFFFFFLICFCFIYLLFCFKLYCLVRIWVFKCYLQQVNNITVSFGCILRGVGDLSL